MEENEVGSEANKRLSIIDVCFEDDSLLDLATSSAGRVVEDRNPDMRGNGGQETCLVEPVESEKWSYMKDSLEDVEKSFQEVPQPFKSCEPEMNGPNGKYNLRNSLAWDSAFFTSAGVLEPEELTCIIEGSEKKGKLALPRILEETSRSTESISTLESDSLTIASLEAELFQDIRASIQKSAKFPIKDIPTCKKGSKLHDKPPSTASGKVDPGSRGKLKATIGNKKPSLSTGKNTQQLSAVPNMSQIRSVSRGEPIQYPSRPPKLRANKSQLAKRDSVGSNSAKPGKSIGDNTVRRPSLSKAKVTSCPRGSSTKPSRSSISNSGANTEPATSRSSTESSGSALSISLGKSSIRFKNTNSDSSGGKSTSLNVKALPNGCQPTPSHLSSCLMLTSKLTSSISPSSSISEWSSESSSSISSAIIGSNSGKVPSIHGYPSQGSTPPSRRNLPGRGAALPNNGKPTGLRMPSPNIGYFDGMKLSCTPKGAKRRPQTGNFASNGNGSTSTSAGANSNKGNSEKLASANKAGSTRIGNNRRLTTEERDSPQKPTNAKAVAAREHSNLKNSPSPVPTTKGKSQVKEEPISTEGCDLSTEFVDKEDLWSAFQFNETPDGGDSPLIPVTVKGGSKANSEVGVELLDPKKEAKHDGSAGNQSFISEQQQEDTTAYREVLNCTPKHSPSHASPIPTEPFSLKDSFCNQTGDITGPDVEKAAVSPIASDFKENI